MLLNNKLRKQMYIRELCLNKIKKIKKNKLNNLKKRNEIIQKLKILIEYNFFVIL